jgi:hypothetical protein
VAKIKMVFITGIICLIIGLAVGLLCRYIYHDGDATDGITANNIELTAKLVAANNRIKQLESQSKIDAGTIAGLRTDCDAITASRDKLKSAYNRLAELIKQQGSSINNIAGGNDGDSKSLQRLYEINANLPKEN